MSTLVDAVKTAVRAAVDALPPSSRSTGPIGVACSGGIDSMALAHATIAAAGASRVVVVTIDHDLVPTSGEVAAAVASWARGQGATAVVRVVDVDRDAATGIESAARVARYAALEQLIAEHHLVAMLLGHTARDQAETVLMRIVRGTGPAGLAGMSASRPASESRSSESRPSESRSSELEARASFVRPMLHLSREVTEAYVREHRLPTWHDPMNADPAITRVRVRDRLLPLLRAENPAVDDALVRLADATREWLDVIDELAAPLGRFPIDCPKLAGQRPAIRKRALAIALDRESIGYDAPHLDALDDLVMAATRGEVGIDLSGARAVRSYDRLDLVRTGRSNTGPDPGPDAGSDARRHSPPDTAGDPPRFRAPSGYMLRAWQPGDRMCPLRLKGHSRKLSDLYIDAKVPREARRIAQVMVRDGDNVIVWAEHIGIAFGEALDLVPVPV